MLPIENWSEYESAQFDLNSIQRRNIQLKTSQVPGIRRKRRCPISMIRYIIEDINSVKKLVIKPSSLKISFNPIIDVFEWL